MRAEVLERLRRPDPRPSRVRNDDLAAVSRRRDTRRDVDDLTHVSVVSQRRDPGVDADPDQDRSSAESRGQLTRGAQRFIGGRERDEERIALRVDFDAAMRSAGPSDDLPVLGKRIGIGIRSEFPEQARGALDVAREKGDCSARQVRSHRPSMAARGPSVKMVGAVLPGRR